MFRRHAIVDEGLMVRAGWVAGAVQVNDLLALGNDESQNDGWAPLDGPKVCQDEAQRWRPEHPSEKDGVCIFCSARTRTGL